MGKIRPLSEAMIGKIAAGEVVERPAAAIKELVENSLDAGATRVTVEIREGGLSRIRVSDDGSGIDESDLRLAFERHATSKISQEADLFSIQTLGFRGEALASIAAVSRVTLTTRTADRDTGLRVRNGGGRLPSVSEAAAPQGTTVVVEDLFYNVPVRRGFMKKASQEAALIHDLMVQLMLSRPEVSFRYISDGKTEYHSPGDGQLLSALHTVYGGAAARTFRPVEGMGNGLLISGYVGIGENARGNRNHELFFINGRVMHSRLLNEAVETGCRERVMIGKFPVCALHLTIPYNAVDVNVHPNKLEVRFRDERGVYEATLTAVVQSLKEPDAFARPVEMPLVKEQKQPEGGGEEVPSPGPVGVNSDQRTGEPRTPETAGGSLSAGTAAKGEGSESGETGTSQTKRIPAVVVSNVLPPEAEAMLESAPAAVPAAVPAASPFTQAEPVHAQESIPAHDNALSDKTPENSNSGILRETSQQTASWKVSTLGALRETASPAVSREGPTPGSLRETPQPEVSRKAQPAPEPVPTPVPVPKSEQINTILPAMKRPMKIFGAVFNTFILIEYEDQLLLVDQHAVHERLLFDRFMREHGQEAVAGQELLVPLILPTTRRELQLLEENREALESIGLVAEPFGEREVAVRTLPMILGEAQTRDFLLEALSELDTGKNPTFEKKRAVLLQAACKHAVKGGDPLSEDQLRELLDRMIDEKVTPTCPHGRPLVVAISHRELDRKFKRIQ